MKLIKFYVIAMVLNFATLKSANAQSFTTQFDTAFSNAHFCPHPNLLDTVITPDTVNMYWKIVASNFPSDWIPYINIIDNALSYNNSALTLWNGTSGDSYNATYYPGYIYGDYFACGTNLTGTTTPGTYWLKVQLTDSNTLYSKNIWFILTRFADTLLPNAGVISGASSVCLGSNITLSETVAGGTWGVANGHATVSSGIVASVTSGIDTIQYSVNNTCATTVATKVVSIDPLPSPVASASGVTLSASPSYVTYQWFLATTPITGATNSTYDAISNGTYYVTVTDANGCSGTSFAVNVTNVSVSNISSSKCEVKVYPNPANSALKIESLNIVNVKLTTIDGRMIIEKQKTSEIDLSKINNGIYLLSVYDTESGIKIKTERVTKLSN